MINANELRIGNYLEFDGLMSIIKEIDEQGCVFDLENGDNVWIDLFQMMPIPLTEQWLFDFGFQIEQNGWYLEAKKNNLVFDISYILEEITLINSFKRVAIKHVHQLQNLYFALIGQELTLKQK